MITTNPTIEDGVLAGNAFDKYNTRNPIARRMVAGFLDSVRELVESTGATDLHETGCGEGALSLHLAARNPGLRIRGSDFSEQIIATAKANAAATKRELDFFVASIYDLDPARHSAPLVLCCEVLEHLEEPERALAVLATLARPHLIVSVPREPLWRVLNMARGKYLGQLGNTPGHINHWSRRRFVELLERYVDVRDVRTPTPWTMALCEARPST